MAGLVDYDPQLPAKFEAIATELRRVFGDPVALEHVGSTAVEGLAGKGTIDVAMGVADLAAVEGKAEAMAAIGYEIVVPPDRPWERRFRRGDRFPREVIVHAVLAGSEHWQDMLAFRDALRASAALRAEYTTLKQRLTDERGDWYNGRDKEELISRVVNAGRPPT